MMVFGMGDVDVDGDGGGDCGDCGGGGTYALSPNPIAAPPAILTHRLQDSTSTAVGKGSSYGQQAV